MYRIIITSVLGLAACGPQVDVPAEDAGGSSDSSSTPTTDDAGMTSEASSSSGAADATSSGSSGDTGATEIVPPEWVTTMASCNDDGTHHLFIEAFLTGEIEQCIPAPTPELDTLLQIAIPSWNQLPGTFEVGPDAPAIAAFGGEFLTGTVTLELSAPGQPSRLTVDLTGPVQDFAGVLELETCTVELDDCMAPPGD